MPKKTLTNHYIDNIINECNIVEQIGLVDSYSHNSHVLRIISEKHGIITADHANPYKLLVEFLTEQHIQQAQDEPIQWLFDWNPSLTKIHFYKSVHCMNLSFPVLIKLLQIITQHEINLLEESNDRPEKKLWQGVSDSRDIRNVLLYNWEIHQDNDQLTINNTHNTNFSAKNSFFMGIS